VKIYIVKEVEKVSQTGPRVVRLNSCKGRNLRGKRANGPNKNFGPASVIYDQISEIWNSETWQPRLNQLELSREIYLEKRVYIGLTSYG